jgi:2-keto-3-deoxy-L-fuconate dehydrogenase
MAPEPGIRYHSRPTDNSPGEGEMTQRLAGKRAFVTAAGQGIGRAIAAAFAREGAEVTATDLDPGKLAGLDAAGVARTAALDVRDGAAVAALAAATGAVDILANCAGFVHHGTVLDCDEAEWARSFDINVTSMHRTLRAFVPGMLDARNRNGARNGAGGGSIVNIASIASSVRGLANRYVYGATKAAVIGLTKAVAADFVTLGIRANAICPGTVATPSLDERIAALGATMGGTEKARAAFVARQPMGRLGTPEEIAGLAVFLASDEAAFVTGQAYMIDGGMTI